MDVHGLPVVRRGLGDGLGYFLLMAAVLHSSRLTHPLEGMCNGVLK